MRRWIVFGKREWVGPHHTIRSGTFPDFEMTKEEYSEAAATQPNTPVLVGADFRRCLWWFRDEFYHHPSDEDNPQVIKGLIIQKLQREERRREKAIETAQREQRDE